MEPKQQLPSGIIPIVQTPYTAAGAVDIESLRRLVDYTITCGASALIVPAVASEVERLSADDIRTIEDVSGDVMRRLGYAFASG